MQMLAVVLSAIVVAASGEDAAVDVSASLDTASGEDAAVDVSASEQSDDFATPMGKVVQLLGKLEKQVQGDGEKDAKVFSATQILYYKEVEKSTKIIKTSKASIAELTTAIAEQKALRAAKKKGLDNTAKSLAKAQKDLVVTAQKREADHASFVKSEKMTVDAIDELTRALAVTKKKAKAGAAFLDEGDDDDDAAPEPTGPVQSLSSVAVGLRKMFAQSPDMPLSDYQRDTLDGFVRASAEEDDELPPLSDYQPSPSFLQTKSQDQGPYGAYNVQIGGVRDTLKQLLTASTKGRDASLSKERKAKTTFLMFEKPLATEIGTKKKSMTELKAQIAKSSQTTATKSADLATAKKLLAITEKYLKELHLTNAVTLRDYKARMDKRTDELLAIQEATAILSSKAAKRFQKKQSIGTFDQEYIGLLQVSQSRRAAIGMIRSASSSGMVLMALKSQTHLMSGAKPFKKVKRMIQQMLAKLLKEQAKDAQKKVWCDSEMSKTKQSKKEKQQDVSKLKNRLASMNAALVQLKVEITTIKSDVKAMMSALQKATKVRTKQKALNLASIKEYKDAQLLVGDALKVLNSFYNKKTGTASAKTGKGGWRGAKTGKNAYKAGTSMASGIIGILEIAKQDFADLERELSIAEAAAAKDYKTLKNESQVKLAVFTTDLKYKSTKRIKMKGDRTRLIADLKGYERELAAVLAYYKKLKPMCVIQSDPYEVRAKRRAAELKSLQNALQVLAGKAI